MTFATFRAAAEHVARAGAMTPHQLAAWEAAWERATTEQRQEFTDLWRAQGSPAAPAPPAELVTMAQATAVFTRSPSASQLADLNSCLRRFAFNTPARIRHFLAQVGHESGGLRWMLELASGDAYEGRQDLGNTRTGDGRRFKGAGAIQLTGRYNYQRFADYIKDPDVMDGASYVSIRYPFTSAGFWWHLNAINAFVDQGASCRQVSAKVNGRDPANGLADREAYFARAVAAISLAGRPAVHLQQSTGYGNPLQVPWYAQMDSADRDQAARMCFSSSCAMLLQYLKPGTLAGPNGDDQYLKRVQQYGDTTDPTAQIRALSSFGIRAKFTKVAGFADLEQQINRGVPVPVGFLHRGPVSAPSGGGHWLIVVGYTKDHLVVHDPFGEADLVSGATPGGVARFARYSRRNFGPRWQVEGANTGWAVIAER
jgi:predicted chitinase